MNEYCLQAQKRICGLITDERIKDSFRKQCRCICPSACIRGYDMVMEAPQALIGRANELLEKLISVSIGRPTLQKRITADGMQSIRITASPRYRIKLQKIILHAGGRMTEEGGSARTFRYRDTEILLIESLCGGLGEADGYSEDVLIGRLLGLSDILMLTKYDAIKFAPQVSAVLDGSLRCEYQFAFLHDLALYIAEHRERIDWSSVLSVLAKMQLSTVWRVLIGLFNYLYSLIPPELLSELTERSAVHNEGHLSDEIWECIARYCTSADMLNNNYRRLYEACLTAENSTGRSCFCYEKSCELSFDEANLTYRLDHSTENPYGSPIYHGDDRDDFENLSVDWGVFTCGDRLCFLLKIHNAFITPETPPSQLNGCHSVIVISAADDRSHKLTELVIRPSFGEDGELTIEISDVSEQDMPLKEHLNCRYKREGEYIHLALSLDKAYLHLTDRFGLDLLTSALRAEDGGSHYACRVLAWSGCSKLWRDLRAMVPFELRG